MAKKRPIVGKLSGKSVAFVGKFGCGNNSIEGLQAAVIAEGGTVIDGEKTEPDYVVAGKGIGGKPPGAVAKIQKKYPSVQVLDEADFHRMVVPTPEEFMAILKSGPHPYDFWYRYRVLTISAQTTVLLHDQIFRGLDLTGSNLNCANVEYGDFLGANLTSVTFDKVKGVKFDGMNLTSYSFSNAQDCSFKNANLSHVRFYTDTFANCNFSNANMSLAKVYSVVLVNCDFTGADLTEVDFSYSKATGCKFLRAKLGSSKFEQSQFAGCDFSKADLSGVEFKKCDFTGSNLSGADFSRADLRGAKFARVELCKAKFNDAILSNADFAGAIIDGADFAGAIVMGANFAGLDTTKAKNLHVRAARPAGPHMRELAKVAAGVKKLKTQIVLDLGDGTVSIEVFAQLTVGGVRATYVHRPLAGGYPNNSHDAASFEQGMLNLADRWDHGKPKFDTVKVETIKCPLSKKELRDLAISAWCEALGIPNPSESELTTQAEEMATNKAALCKEMLAELTGGPKGLKKWNARPQLERFQVGKLRNMDFSGAKLLGIELEDQDLQGSIFDRATLKKANFRYSKLQETSFVGANLTDVDFGSCKATDASFEDAILRGCRSWHATWLRCNFRGADLTKASFSFANIGGADFRTATLDDVSFFHSEFDEKTIFPPGFTYPDGLVWKGAGLRPGTPAVVVAPAGTVDFDSFIANLTTKIEAGRIKNATSMLKSERFQLFAEVTDDSLVGIVKSQSSAERVYSCRLCSDGSFSCCTQNLLPCGGLRGAICKHLLVMVIGLSKAGQLDPATADGWVDKSRQQQPKLDKDIMSEAFLRYKGAEAGEIDWRPTETIPEDFYAM